MPVKADLGTEDLSVVPDESSADQAVGTEIEMEDTPVEEDDPVESVPASEVAVDTETVTLQRDTYLVVCEYLPKLYVEGMLLLGALIFAFTYLVIRKDFTRLYE